MGLWNENDNTAHRHHRLKQVPVVFLAQWCRQSINRYQGVDGVRAHQLCESRGGRPGLPVPNSPCGLCGRKAMFEEEESWNRLLNYQNMCYCALIDSLRVSLWCYN